MKHDSEETKEAAIEALIEAAQRLCTYCARYDEDNEGALPYTNEKGVLAHRTFSSRGLGSEHACRAEAIHCLILEYEEKAVDSPG